jgi:pimeloyl-ACP methyl ester carboxylesterase
MRIVLASGRRVAVHRSSARNGWLTFDRADRSDEERVVVLCHGAPGAGGFDPDPTHTQARGVALLSVDRPGYGGSDPVPAGEWATVDSAADDLAVVLDGLGAENVGVVGWSAGGRVALALAARRPDLVDRVVVIGTPAPDEEVPWIEPEERDELDRLRDLPPAEAQTLLAARLAPLVPADPHAPDALWLLGAGVTEADALCDGTRTRLGDLLAAAFAQGSIGLAADIAGYCLQPWGFEPEEVEAKTLLLYGSHDPIAGAAHGHWWQSRLPNAQLELAFGLGHLLLIPTWPRALAHAAPGRVRLRSLVGGREDAADEEFEGFSAA